MSKVKYEINESVQTTLRFAKTEFCRRYKFLVSSSTGSNFFTLLPLTYKTSKENKSPTLRSDQTILFALYKFALYSFLWALCNYCFGCVRCTVFNIKLLDRDAAGITVRIP